MTDRRPARAAVVVIHGIGEQPGVATLGRFAQGLVDHAGASQPSARLRQVGGNRLPLLRTRLPEVRGEVDVLEYSWQHLVQGRISVFATLGWLLGTVLAPLQFRRHWRVLASASTGAPAPWFVVLRQLAVAVALLLPVVLVPLAVVTAAGWALSQPRPEPLLLPQGQLGLLLVSAALAAVALLQLVALLRDGLEAVQISRRTRRLHGVNWHGLHGGAARGWRWPALMAVLLTVAGAWLLAVAAAPAPARLLEWLTRDGHRGFSLAALLLCAAAAVGWWFLKWLRDYVGDIALYVTADRQPAADRGRHAIKTGAARLVQALLRDSDYDRVVLVGHSLGSVIALDALNELSRDQRVENRGPKAPLGKLAGLLTFGSPLDKVAYFFREQPSDSAAVHAQLLSFLHATGRLPSQRDDGPYRLARYDDPLKGLRWTNLHAGMDVISDPLLFYRVGKRQRHRYFPVGAHGRYWHDARTYAALKQQLQP